MTRVIGINGLLLVSPFIILPPKTTFLLVNPSLKIVFIAFAGAAATIASDALMNPFDGTSSPFSWNNGGAGRPKTHTLTTVIKQRMQVHKSEFRSALTCARTVYANEGLSAFYVSYPTTLTMTVPFTAVQFTVYGQLKMLLNPSNSY